MYERETLRLSVKIITLKNMIKEIEKKEKEKTRISHYELRRISLAYRS